MLKRSIRVSSCALLLGVFSLAGEVLAQQPPDVLPSSLTVKVEKVGSMPSVLGLGFVVPPFAPLQPNLASPVTIKKKLYLIDQNDGIYRLNGSTTQKIFSVEEAPDGLALDNRQSILNVAEGSRNDTMYVAFTSGTLPTADIPLYEMPAPLPGVCCLPTVPVPDLYRIGDLSLLPPPSFLFGVTRTEYQVLYEFKVAGNKLKSPRAIAAFETQSGPTHNGGGMLTLEDGRILFATGDGLPFGAEGRAAPQDPASHLSKLLIVDPNDGSFEVAAMGLRNVQRMEYSLFADTDGVVVSFADIGGVTAEEVNYASLADLLDTSSIENFGWGRNSDGLAREGTFYVAPGLPLVPGTDPPLSGVAPSPESGFIQPQAQYGRNDTGGLGGVAVSGPVTSLVSFDEISAAFTDLASGFLYATVAGFDETNVEVFLVNLVDGAGSSLASLNDLEGGRVDPRLFRFPDGSAGVLLESSGDFYRLTEID